MKMKCLAQGHKTAPRRDSHPRPCDQESCTSPTELPVLPKVNIERIFKMKVYFLVLRWNPVMSSPNKNVKIRADKRNCRETDKVGN